MFIISSKLNNSFDLLLSGVSNPWADGDHPTSVVNTSPPIQISTTAPPAKVSDAEFWLNSTANQIDPFAGVPNVGLRQTSVRARGASVTTAPVDAVLSPHIITTPVFHHNSVTVTPQRVIAVHPPVMMSARPVGVNSPLISSVVSQPLVVGDVRLQQQQPHPQQPFASFNAQQVSALNTQQFSPAGNARLMGFSGPQQVAVVNSQQVTPFNYPASGAFPTRMNITSSTNAQQVTLSSGANVTSLNDSIQKQSRVEGGFTNLQQQQPLDPFESAWAAKTTSRGVVSSASITNNPFQTSLDNMTPAFHVKL